MLQNRIMAVLAAGLLAGVGALLTQVGQAPASAAAATTTSPVADGYVKQTSPSSNYGTGLLMRAQAAPATARSFLRFAVTGLNGAPPAAAVLKVMVDSASTQGITASSVSSTSWSEAGTTWLNQPPSGGTLSTSGPVPKWTWVSLNVTPAVHGDGLVSVMLSSASGTSVDISSRESTHPPQLTVTAGPTPTPTPTATSTPPPGVSVTKVLTVVEENHSLAQMKAGMPYLYSLARQYGYADHYTAIRHPSLPNYLAIAGGDTFGVTDDASPSAHVIHGASVFGQALSAGRSARTYAEGMTTDCMTSNTGRYAVKHNPWVYFADERAGCVANDVPAGTPTSGRLSADITAGTLPSVGLVVPDLCNDAHDCPLTTADNWLRNWLPKMLAGPDFRAGRLAVVVTADEDDSSAGNLVLTTVLHPTLNGSATVVWTPMSHYSLTRYYDEVLHLAPLRGGESATSLGTAFRLPAS